MFFDPREQAVVEYVIGHRGFELRTADEEDQGMKAVFRDAEELRQSFHMEVVLMEWILEAIFRSVDLLGPLALFLGAEDPAFVVFGLDDKDAEGGDDDVIELGGALSIRSRQIEIVELPVELRIQPIQAPADHPLAEPTLEGCRAKEFEQDIETQQRREGRPVGKERAEELLE